MIKFSPNKTQPSTKQGQAVEELKLQMSSMHCKSSRMNVVKFKEQI